MREAQLSHLGDLNKMWTKEGAGSKNVYDNSFANTRIIRGINNYLAEFTNTEYVYKHTYDISNQYSRKKVNTYP